MKIQDLIDAGTLLSIGHQLIVSDKSALQSLLDELDQLRAFSDMLASEERQLKGD